MRVVPSSLCWATHRRSSEAGFTFLEAMHVRMATCPWRFLAAPRAFTGAVFGAVVFARSSKSSLSLRHQKCAVQQVDQLPV